MILEFSVKNFLSFKEKVTFSMIANSNKELNDNYVEIGGYKVLKSAAIYGANASGKSNLIKALTLSQFEIAFCMSALALSEAIETY